MKSVQLNMPDGRVRTFLHRDSVADRGVLTQIFKQRDYALSQINRGPELRGLGHSLPRPLIIDAGANMGASVTWFATGFPHAHIVAIEPDGENFGLLRQNTYDLDVDLRHAALGSHEGMAEVMNMGNGEWGYQTKPAEDGTVPLVSMAGIVADKIAAGYQPFIAKIDIEGGEAELFSASTDWIDEFPLVIVELHDWMIPGQARSRTFLQAIAGRDRDFVQVGENTFSIRNPVIPAAAVAATPA